MNIILTNNGNVYEQIVNHFKKYIELGIYKNNEKLPSCRDLAGDLGVNPNTVSKAYNKLEEEHYIVAIPKKGIYVKYEKKNSSSKIREMIEEIKKTGIEYNEFTKILREVYDKC